MNIEGYQNLMKLASIAQFEGFYYKPRIDMEVLRQYSGGLIAMSACLHGWVPWLILQQDMDRARRKALEFKEIFGDRYYFEIQENGMSEQQVVNDALIALGRELGIKVVPPTTAIISTATRPTPTRSCCASRPTAPSTTRSASASPPTSSTSNRPRR